MPTLDVNGFHIDKKSISEAKLASIKSRLTVSPRSMDGAETVEYEQFTETDNVLTVPRFFGMLEFQKEKIDNKLSDKQNHLEFTKTLRNYQEDITKTCLDHLQKFGGGLLSIGCGRGKTVIALNIACALKMKTLVVVHKEFLQNQWAERIEQFTNASTGIIRSKKADVKDKDIVVAMIHSISKRDYGDIFKDFGFVIYDEAHHTPAKMFSNTLKRTGAKYLLALSATPYRNDGLIKILHWYVGDTIYREGARPNPAVCVKLINYKSKHPKFIEKRTWSAGKVRPNLPMTINNIYPIKDRTKIITKVLEELRKDTARKILVLSSRKHHLQKIKNKIDLNIKKDIEKGKLKDDEYNTFYYIGDMNENERKEAEAYGDMLFGTYDLAHEGLDIARLNTVVLATPKKDIVQTVGRIQRNILTPGDIRPLIVDFADNIPIFQKHCDIRTKYYKTSQYSIEKYYCEDREFVLPSKFYGTPVDKDIEAQRDKFTKVRNICKTEPVSEADLLTCTATPVIKTKQTYSRSLFGKKK